ncbi:MULTISPECIES: ABC transporter substrate-binding protein [Allofournierella]|uniref:ABC transporter substrate-binding protein n=1 Tax=Allofournierella massiliensis TaxID=1650663 RepID=A0ABT7UUI9_9FIRM|nr:MULTISPECIES: ABC transporter substrate-binding protein [Fournierella]MDM8201983.1 ABC transporter substrate-binding protein [Fournierella massiliensis]
MKIKQCAALLMAATMAAVSLVGCGGSDAASGSGATAASGDTIVVDFWTAPQQVQYNLWESRAQAFNATGTQVNGKTVTVKVQQMPETPSSEAGIQNAIATGTAPAVSENVNRGFAATLAASDVVYDLSSEDWFNDVVESRAMGETMDAWAIDGKQYVLPLYVNPMVWQWNMKGLQALGYDKAPETVAEFTEVMKAFAANKDALAEVGVTHSFYRPSLTRPDQYWDRWFDFMMIYNGVSGGKSIVEGNKLTMDRDAAIQAMEVIGTFGNTIQQGELSSIWLEEQPSVLVSINAPWEISLYRENNVVYGEDYVYGPALVNNAGDKPYNYADSKGLAFYKADNISEEEHLGAVEFVKWVYNAENSAQSDLEWLEATTMLPVRGDLNTSETFTAIMEEYPELADLAQWVPYSIPGLATDKDADIWTAFTETCTGPYMNDVMQAEAGNAPDASSYVDAAMEAMKTAGGLE